MKAKAIARPREQHDYLVYEARKSNRRARYEKAFRSLSYNPARIWLNQDSPDYGFWSRSIFEYLASSHDVNPGTCSLFSTLAHTWSSADPLLVNSVKRLETKFKNCTSAQNN
jgi:hypothetical protein